MSNIKLLIGRTLPISGGFWNSDPNYPSFLKPHIGTDYPTNTGTEIKVFAYCHVIKIGGHSDYGTQLFLYLPNDDVTLHIAHLSAIHKDVRVGDGRYIGFPIAHTGATGKGFDGSVVSNGVVPHVHVGLARGRVTDTQKKHDWIPFDTFKFTLTNNDGTTPKPAPKPPKTYINLTGATYAFYDVNLPIEKMFRGNHKGVLLPSEFDGLSYTATKRNGSQNVYYIDTRDFGRVQVAHVEGRSTLTNTPAFGLIK